MGQAHFTGLRWTSLVTALMALTVSGCQCQRQAKNGHATLAAVGAPVDLSATRDGAEVSLTWAAGDASTTSYLVVRRVASPVDWAPENGIQYEPGTAIDTEQIVLATGPEVAFSDGGLALASAYHYAVFALASDTFSSPATVSVDEDGAALPGDPDLPAAGLWSPNDQVNVMARAGGLLYLGGDFSYVGPQTGDVFVADVKTTAGQACDVSKTLESVTSAVSAPDGGWYVAGRRRAEGDLPTGPYLVRLDEQCRRVETFDASVDGPVYALTLKDERLYLAGDFSAAGGVGASGLAVLDATTGASVASWPATPPISTIATLTAGDQALYVGGSFTTVGKALGGAASIEPDGDFVCRDSQAVKGTVTGIASDGAGGWYLSGSMMTIDGLARTGVAHFKADCSLSEFAPQIVGTVKSLALHGTTLYIAGLFSSVNGVSRGYLASLSTLTGELTDWTPEVDDWATFATIQNGKLYVGGAFTTVDGQARMKLARFHAASGALDPTWAPPVNGQVTGLTAAGGIVYLVGNMTKVNDIDRRGVAALQESDGALVTGWDPVLDGSAYALAIAGGDLYVGGGFTTVDGQSRGGLAAIDLATGNLAAWTAAETPVGDVRALASDGTRLYVGRWRDSGTPTSKGSLSSFALSDGSLTWKKLLEAVQKLEFAGGRLGFAASGGMDGVQARDRLAAFDLATGNLLPWNPGADDFVDILVFHDNEIIAGGDFSTIGGQSQPYLAVIDVNGALTAWTPALDGTVNDLVVDDDRLYVGGAFRHVDGQERGRLAAFALGTGGLTSFDPKANDDVEAIAMTSAGIVAGGAFTTIGDLSRRHLVVLDPASGTPTSFNIVVGDVVRNLAASADRVLVSGSFVSTGGVIRNGLAALSENTGAATDWEPNPNSMIQALVSDGRTLFVGGSFSTIAGVARQGLAAFDVATGDLRPLDLGLDNGVTLLATSDEVLYLHGDFSTVAGQPRAGLAAIDLVSGALLPWQAPAVAGAAMVATSAGVIVGGSFTTIDGQPRQNLAAFHLETGALLAWAPNPDDNVLTLAVNGQALYVGGSFDTMDGEARPALARFDLPGLTLSPWTNDGIITTRIVAATSSSVYLCGSYQAPSEPSRICVGLDAESGDELSWDAGLGHTVNSLRLASDRLYAGGRFSLVGGQNRGNLAAVELVTGALMTTEFDSDD